MKKKAIHFVLNPISGAGSTPLTLEKIRSVFNNKNYKTVLKTTAHINHATELTQQSIKENAEIIVACGGDGTINEVASCLTNTTIKLGIIRLGSGNGLASNLQIPKQIVKALELIRSGESTAIDVGKINGKYFFSNTGIGFDANVINNYQAAKGRQLLTYLKSTIKTYFNRFESLDVEFATNTQSLKQKAFMLFISNSNEMGYTISLTPKASVQDGVLDVVLVEELNRAQILYFALMVLLKRTHKFKKAQYFQTSELRIKLNNKTAVLSQIDGEVHQLSKDQHIQFNLLPKALQVIC